MTPRSPCNSVLPLEWYLYPSLPSLCSCRAPRSSLPSWLLSRLFAVGVSGQSWWSEISLNIIPSLHALTAVSASASLLPSARVCLTSKAVKLVPPPRGKSVSSFFNVETKEGAARGSSCFFTVLGPAAAESPAGRGFLLKSGLLSDLNAISVRPDSTGSMCYGVYPVDLKILVSKDQPAVISAWISRGERNQKNKGSLRPPPRRVKSQAHPTPCHAFAAMTTAEGSTTPSKPSYSTPTKRAVINADAGPSRRPQGASPAYVRSALG